MQTGLIGTWDFCHAPLLETLRHYEQTSKKKTVEEVGEEPQYTLADLVVDAIEKVELKNDQPTVGAPGSKPNSHNFFELDAAIMSQTAYLGAQTNEEVYDGYSGAVLSLQNFDGAIRVAQKVGLKSSHSTLAGFGAENFGEKCCCNGELLDERIKQLRRRRKEREPEQEGEETGRRKNSEKMEQEQQKEYHHQDTLGVVGIRYSSDSDSTPNGVREIVAAVSSSGLAAKEPGRVGDSAIFGSGLFADVNVGAAVCTGDGDAIALFPISAVAVQYMKMKKPETRQQVSDCLALAISDFLKSPAVMAFVRNRKVKDKLSGKLPYVAMVGVSVFASSQFGAASSEEWKSEFSFAHASIAFSDESRKIVDVVEKLK